MRFSKTAIETYLVVLKWADFLMKMNSQIMLKSMNYLIRLIL